MASCTAATWQVAWQRCSWLPPAAKARHRLRLARQYSPSASPPACFSSTIQPPGSRPLATGCRKRSWWVPAEGGATVERRQVCTGGQRIYSIDHLEACSQRCSQLTGKRTPTVAACRAPRPSPQAKLHTARAPSGVSCLRILMMKWLFCIMPIKFQEGLQCGGGRRAGLRESGATQG